jgi:FlaG/FlaF family flagellin (archaellin)
MARAVSSVIGVVLLVALVVLGAGTMSLALAAEPADPAPIAAFELAVDADSDRLAITHRGGDALDLTATRIRIEVGDETLTHQPPVPFFAASGFESGPTGPFNSASDDTWQPGETGTLELASTNSPELTRNSTVTVRVYADGTEIATVRST